MTEDKITTEERVFQAVAKVFRKDIGEIHRETRFVEDLFSKSLNVIELIAVLENEFNIEIPMHEARKNKTVGEAVQMVERLLLQ